MDPEVFKRALMSLAPQLQGAVVYLDRAASEIFHWNVSTKTLILLGVADLHYSFSTRPSQADTRNGPPLKKLAFFLTSYVTEYEAAMRAVLAASPECTECHIYNALPEHAYERSSPLKGPFEELEDRVLTWFPSGPDAPKRVTRVAHFPLVYSDFVPNVFLIPAAHDSFPPINSEEVVPERLPTDYFKEDEKSLLLVHSLSVLLSLFNLKEECYAIGRLSQLVGRELNTFARQHYSFPVPPQRNASLILIDRTLDLVAPLAHNDNLLDRVYAMLPPLGPFSNDRKIRLYPEQAFQQFKVHPNACLAHPDNSHAIAVLDSVASKKSKESFNLVCKRLLDVISEEKLQLSLSQKPSSTLSPATLIGFLKQFPIDSEVYQRNHALIELVSGLVQTLQAAKDSAWDRVQGVEKILMLSAADKDAAQSPVAQLTELLETADVSTLPAKHLLQLTLLLYSLLGTSAITKADERNLEKAFVDVLLKVPQSTEIGCLGSLEQELANSRLPLQESDPEFASKSAERAQFKQALTEKLREVFAFVQAAGRERETLKSYRGLLRDAVTGTYIPLTQQLVADLFDDKTPEIPDLEKLTRAIGALLSSFGFQAKKPRVRDTVVIIFVIGGVTCTEIERIKEIAAKYGHTQVLVGSTRIATAESTFASTLLGE